MLIAASDYVKAMPDSIDRWLPRPLTVLGTDGFGRSESRAALRDFFEVDYRYVIVATLAALARDGKIDASVVDRGDQGAQHQSREEQSGDVVDATECARARRDASSLRRSASSICGQRLEVLFR